MANFQTAINLKEKNTGIQTSYKRTLGNNIQIDILTTKKQKISEEQITEDEQISYEGYCNKHSSPKHFNCFKCSKIICGTCVYLFHKDCFGVALLKESNLLPNIKEDNLKKLKDYQQNLDNDIKNINEELSNLKQKHRTSKEEFKKLSSEIEENMKANGKEAKFDSNAIASLKQKHNDMKLDIKTFIKEYDENKQLKEDKNITLQKLKLFEEELRNAKSIHIAKNILSKINGATIKSKEDNTGSCKDLNSNLHKKVEELQDEIKVLKAAMSYQLLTEEKKLKESEKPMCDDNVMNQTTTCCDEVKDIIDSHPPALKGQEEMGAECSSSTGFQKNGKWIRRLNVVTAGDDRCSTLKGSHVIEKGQDDIIQMEVRSISKDGATIADLNMLLQRVDFTQYDCLFIFLLHYDFIKKNYVSQFEYEIMPNIFSEEDMRALVIDYICILQPIAKQHPWLSVNMFTPISLDFGKINNQQSELYHNKNTVYMAIQEQNIAKFKRIWEELLGFRGGFQLGLQLGHLNHVVCKNKSAYRSMLKDRITLQFQESEYFTRGWPHEQPGKDLMQYDGIHFRPLLVNLIVNKMLHWHFTNRKSHVLSIKERKNLFPDVRKGADLLNGILAKCGPISEETVKSINSSYR